MANRKQIHNIHNDSLRATTTVLRITRDIPKCGPSTLLVHRNIREQFLNHLLGVISRYIFSCNVFVKLTFEHREKCHATLPPIILSLRDG